MELTNTLKDLVKAHEMACITDFVNEDYADDYLENCDFDLEEIERICKKYDGWGMSSLEDSILNILKEYI